MKPRSTTLTGIACLILGIACAAPGHRSSEGDVVSTREEAKMNGTDSSTAPDPQSPVRRPYLPAIVSLRVERIPWEPPRYEFVESVLADVKEALAFDVELKEELPLDRGATPVLYVGSVELSAVEAMGEMRYRFLAFPAEEEAMRRGAPISLGWPGENPHPETLFRFEGEGQATY